MRCALQRLRAAGPSAALPARWRVRRAPALLENLAQALLMAPLFVVLEVIFLLGGCAALEEEV